MAENPEDWQPWIVRACEAVGVDPELVDAQAVLKLTKTVAERYVRPMAPVAAHILGLALATQGASAREELIDRLTQTLPVPANPEGLPDDNVAGR